MKIDFSFAKEIASNKCFMSQKKIPPKVDCNIFICIGHAIRVLEDEDEQPHVDQI